ncbi:MAG: hypothetical protein Q7N50_12635 [Armatimonadota bacterium]|nr:hypothetical protein [Armatimonadota bacterium]
MSGKRVLLCVLVVMCVFCAAAQGAVIYVKTTGNDANSGTNWDLAKRTVQAGVNAASSGGQVWVAKGTYDECIALKDGVALYGGFAGAETSLSQRPGFPRQSPDSNEAVLNGDQSATVVEIDDTSQSTRIDGFTIRNGGGLYSMTGGGIHCFGSPTIVNNNITGNGLGSSYLGYAYGGGIYTSGGSPVICDNRIVGNDSSIGSQIWAEAYGGGIYCDGGSPVIRNNVIRGNTVSVWCSSSFSGAYAGAYGGGLYVYGGSPTVSGNIIAGNSVYASAIDNGDYGSSASSAGGGVCIYAGSSATVVNNTVTDNSVYAWAYPSSSNNGGGIWYSTGASSYIANNAVAFNSSGIYKSGGTPTLHNNDVYGNTSYNYSGVSPGTGDISVNPLFVNRSGGDYHLMASSLCINGGWDLAPAIPAFDMDGEVRKNGVIDIGADEYWPSVATTVREAKLGADGDPVDIDGAIVSAEFVDFFYIESDDQTCGILVNKVGHSLDAEMRVHVIGSLSTNADGERCIDASDAHQCDSPNNTGSVGPLAMCLKALGGVDLGYDAGPPILGQKGVKDGIGLNNIGLLVQVTGKIIAKDTSTPATWFTFDDGSDIVVKAVVQPVVIIPTVGTYVGAIGISSCEKPDSDVLRMIRVYGDIQTLASP